MPSTPFRFSLLLAIRFLLRRLISLASFAAFRFFFAAIAFSIFLFHIFRFFARMPAMPADAACRAAAFDFRCRGSDFAASHFADISLMPATVFSRHATLC